MYVSILFFLFCLPTDLKANATGGVSFGFPGCECVLVFPGCCRFLNGDWRRFHWVWTCGCTTSTSTPQSSATRRMQTPSWGSKCRQLVTCFIVFFAKYCQVWDCSDGWYRQLVTCRTILVAKYCQVWDSSDGRYRQFVTCLNVLIARYSSDSWLISNLIVLLG